MGYFFFFSFLLLLKFERHYDGFCVNVYPRKTGPAWKGLLLYILAEASQASEPSISLSLSLFLVFSFLVFWVGEKGRAMYVHYIHV